MLGVSSMALASPTSSVPPTLDRSLTLDPAGLVQLKNRSAIRPGGVSVMCSGPAAPDATASGSPFCALKANNEVAFQAQQQPEPAPPSPGSAFRKQDAVIETSSSEAEAVTAPAPGNAPVLASAIGTPPLPAALTAPATLSTAPSGALGSLGSCPAHGIKAVCGKRNKMEDMYAVQPNFFDIPLSPTADDVQNKLPHRIAVQLEADCSPSSSLPLSPGAGGAASDLDPSSNSYTCGSDVSASPASCLDTLHFFGVYDGHGGCQAAEHCARRLHHHLSQALATACGCLVADGNQLLLQATDTDANQADWSISSTLMQSVASFAVLGLGSSNGDSAAAAQNPGQLNPLSTSPQGKVCVDGLSSSSCSADDQLGPLPEGDAAFDNDSSGSGSDRSECTSLTSLLEDALKDAFLKTDAEFANDGCAAMVGSTALVALVGSRKIWLANCGDSRAVLCRNAKAVPLTDDHKPEREDEAERVEKAGGQVLYWNGHRVMGVLAMSRAIGDHGLRPYIIPEPEVSVLCRTEDDDFMLLASDGLWDVMTNQDAVDLTNRCIRRAKEKGATRNAAVRIAASVLTKAAIDRGSKDNVTVVIVDLKGNTGSDGSAAPAAGSQTAAVCSTAAKSEPGSPTVACSKACSPPASSSPPSSTAAACSAPCCTGAADTPARPAVPAAHAGLA